MSDRTEIIITVAVTFCYLFLVMNGQADAAGFGMLAMYVIKKALDVREKNEEKK